MSRRGRARINQDTALVGVCWKNLIFELIIVRSGSGASVQRGKIRRCYMFHPERLNPMFAANYKIANDRSQNEWSCISSAGQRIITIVLANCPSTATSALLSMLCCRPGTIPKSQAARVTQLTAWEPSAQWARYPGPRLKLSHFDWAYPMQNVF